MATVCVFCGSRTGDRPEFAAEARSVIRSLAVARHSFVYGGGSTGIMGVVADTVLELGGCITGVIPECLATRELMHDGVCDMRIVSDMHVRKQLMHQMADVYIVLPGGYGTLEELFEAVTWSQLGIHSSPVGVLNCCGYYDGLLDLCERMVTDGLIDVPTRHLLKFTSSSDELSAWICSVTEHGAVRK